MGYMTYVYDTAEYFWKSWEVVLFICLSDTAMLYWFVHSLPRRSRNHLHTLIGFLSAGLLYFVLYMQGYEVFKHSFILLGIIFLTLYYYADIPWQNNMFLSSSFILIVELSRTFIKDGPWAERIFSVDPQFPHTILNLGMLAACFLLLGLLVYRYEPVFRRFVQIPLTTLNLLILLLPFVMYLFIRSTKFYVMTSIDAGNSLLLKMLLAEIGVCAVTITQAVVLSDMVTAQLEINHHLQKEMLLQSQEEQYRIKLETIEVINRKYHDLKHMLTGIKAMDKQEAKDFADALQKEIQPYETIQKTGLPLMDMLLGDLITRCQSKGIRLIPYVDAEPLKFMNDLDLCTLFGNAVDNAIDAVSLLPEDHREIYIKIHRSGTMMILCFENPFDGTLKIREGHLHTRKADASQHGFGTQSILRIAEKYGGSAAYESDEAIFTLNVILPIPEEA